MVADDMMLEESSQTWNTPSDADTLIKSYESFGPLWKGLMALVAPPTSFVLYD